MKHLVSILLLSSCLLNCTAKKKKLEMEQAYVEGVSDSKLISNIEMLIEKEKYAEALAETKAFQEKKSPSKYSQDVNYYSARAAEGLENWEGAFAGYREVIRNPITTDEIKNKALYRQSFVYEALNQDEKVVATLLDLKKRKVKVRDQVFLAEIPARLASIYARLGNRKMADSYYAEAEAGIKELQATQPSGDHRKWLPKTLFFMGNMSAREFREQDFEASIKPLEKAQGYLLRAMTMKDEVWSKKASEELYKIYKDITLAISRVQLPENTDEEVAQKEAQTKKWQMATTATESLKRLRMALDAETDISSESKLSFMTFLDEQEREMGKVLEETPITSRMTVEAQKRQGLKRAGRVENPDPMLEELPKKVPKKGPKK
ncbi:MAG: hypothetical protein SGJ18_01530 [Pseudomonadota bacterium]|nr:hypothetical protein [Pseudomonadota bacterium]